MAAFVDVPDADEPVPLPLSAVSFPLTDTPFVKLVVKVVCPAESVVVCTTTELPPTVAVAAVSWEFSVPWLGETELLAVGPVPGVVMKGTGAVMPTVALVAVEVSVAGK